MRFDLVGSDMTATCEQRQVGYSYEPRCDSLQVSQDSSGPFDSGKFTNKHYMHATAVAAR